MSCVYVCHMMVKVKETLFVPVVITIESVKMCVWCQIVPWSGHSLGFWQSVVVHRNTWHSLLCRSVFAEILISVWEIHSVTGLVHYDLDVDTVHFTHTFPSILGEFPSTAKAFVGTKVSWNLYIDELHHYQVLKTRHLTTSSPSLQLMGSRFRLNQQQKARYQSYVAHNPAHNHNQPYVWSDELFSSIAHHRWHLHYEVPKDSNIPLWHQKARKMWAFKTILKRNANSGTYCDSVKLYRR